MAYEISMQEESLRRGPWLEEEDEKLKAFVNLLGERRWDSLAKQSGLRRSGKSCRLRWLNYLRPNLKHGEINAEEELIIIQLHQQWGNKWAKIARRLPGRTDNEIKNYWRSHLRKKLAKAQGQENLVGEKNIIKQDRQAPISDSVTQTSSNNSGAFLHEEKDVDMSEISDDFSYGNQGSEGEINSMKEDERSPQSDNVTQTSSDNSGNFPFEEKDVVMSDVSDDFSYANYELSNSLFGNSPYAARVSDWLSYEQSEATGGEESWQYFSSFCYPSWLHEEEEQCTNTVWDSPSSLWALD